MNTSVANLVMPVVATPVAAPAAKGTGAKAATKQTATHAQDAPSPQPRQQQRGEYATDSQQQRTAKGDVRRSDAKQGERAEGKADGKKTEKPKPFAAVLQAAQQVEELAPEESAEITQPVTGDVALLATSEETTGNGKPVAAEGQQNAAKTAGLESSTVAVVKQVQPGAVNAQAADTAAEAKTAQIPVEVNAKPTGGAAQATPESSQLKAAAATQGQTEQVAAGQKPSEQAGEQVAVTKQQNVQPVATEMSQSQQQSAKPAGNEQALPEQTAQTPIEAPETRNATSVAQALKPAARPAPRPDSSQQITPAPVQVDASAIDAESRGTTRQGELNAQAISGVSAEGASQVQTQPATIRPTNPELSTQASAPGEQIAQAVRTATAAGEQRVVIRLDPPELGQVRVILHAEGREVRGVVQVDNPRTLEQLRQEAPSLISRLAEAGIEVRRMETGFTPNSGGESTSQWNFRQDGGGAWQGEGGNQGGQDARGGNAAGENSAAEVAVGEQTQSPLPASVIGDGAINVWI